MQDNAHCTGDFKREKGPRRDAVVLNSAAAIPYRKAFQSKMRSGKRRRIIETVSACTAGAVCSADESGVRRLKKFFNRGICVCTHLAQTRYAQKACAEMSGKHERKTILDTSRTLRGRVEEKKKKADGGSEKKEAKEPGCRYRVSI